MTQEFCYSMVVVKIFTPIEPFLNVVSKFSVRYERERERERHMNFGCNMMIVNDDTDWV